MEVYANKAQKSKSAEETALTGGASIISKHYQQFLPSLSQALKFFACGVLSFQLQSEWLQV